ncbi:hypothetical protein ACWDRR_28805 [Kitasatospora sp. NPDC003701]
MSNEIRQAVLGREFGQYILTGMPGLQRQDFNPMASRAAGGGCPG